MAKLKERRKDWEQSTMVNPYTPAQAREAQQHILPEVVITVINEFLAQRSSSSRIIIKQDEVVAALEARGIDRDRIFNEHMLDFEETFKAAGWSVLYDKPGWNETYRANWVFSV